MARSYPLKRDRDRPLTGEAIRIKLREAVNDAESRPVSTSESVVVDMFRKQPLNFEIPVVISRRASGKTTGLVHFIAERTLVLSEDEKLAVVCPTDDIASEFSHHFNTHFPTLKYPTICTAKSVSALRGQKFREVYIEEFFLIPKHQLRDMLPPDSLIIGVGTVEEPTTISVRL
jgi:hypothetical protein